MVVFILAEAIANIIFAYTRCKRHFLEYLYPEIRPLSPANYRDGLLEVMLFVWLINGLELPKTGCVSVNGVGYR